MDLDALLDHFFGPGELDDLAESEFARGIEKMQIAFGIEREPGRRFALWTILEGFGTAPLPADAFAKEPQLKVAAEAYLTAAYRVERDQPE